MLHGAMLNCRLLPHLAISAILILSYGAFSHAAYFVVALLGMLLLMISNARRASKLLRGAGGAAGRPLGHHAVKQHAN